MRKAGLIFASAFLLGIPAHAQTCSKVVSFAMADATGVHPFMGTGDWIGKWVQKNAKKHPDICFSQSPMQGHANYLVVLSQSSGYLTGFDPVVRTDTNMTTTPVSGSGTVTSNYGEVWNYTYNGQVTTTTTTTTEENVPYTINSRTLYVYAYSDGGAIVSQRHHVYSTKSGGDAANSAGYNIGNALGAINARGHMLGSVVKDIESQPVAVSKDECDVDEVWRLGRSLGEKENEIADAIKQRGVCPVLMYLQGEADGRTQHPQQPQAQGVGTAAMAAPATAMPSPSSNAAPDFVPDTNHAHEATVQSTPFSKSVELAKRLLQHQQDFAEFANSQLSNRGEYEISMVMSSIARRTAENLVAMNTLFEMYGKVSNEPDRTKMQPVIKSEALRYSQDIAADMALANANLAGTKLPAIAATGDRMKQDLRDAKAFLDSLQTSLE